MTDINDQGRRAPVTSKRPREQYHVRRRRVGYDVRSTNVVNRATRPSAVKPVVADPVGKTLTGKNESIEAIEHYRGTGNRFGEPVKSQSVSSGKPKSSFGRQTQERKNSAPPKEQKPYKVPDLKLPYTFGQFSFSEKKVGDIRLLSAIDKNVKEKQTEKELDKIAEIISSYNELIGDPKFKMNICFIGPIGDPSGQFVLYKDLPAVALWQYHKPTVAFHEAAHGLFHYFQNSTSAKVGKLSGKAVVRQIADIFVELQKTDISKDFDGTRIVDPRVWQHAKKGETGGNPDEFFASAARAFKVDKNALSKAFTEFGLKNERIKNAGSRLIKLLEGIFGDQNSLTQDPVLNPKEVDERLDYLVKHPPTDIGKGEPGYPTNFLMSPELRP